MHRFTFAERAIKKYYRNSGSLVNMQHELRREVGHHQGFSVQAIRRTVEKFELESTLLNLKHQQDRLVRNEEKITAVAASIEEDPEMSIRHRSAELGIVRDSVYFAVRFEPTSV